MKPFYKPVLSRKWILERTSEEEIFLHYLGFFSLSKKFKNPFREDNEAGCKFYQRNGRTYFKDYKFAPFGGNLDCFHVAQLYHSCDFTEAMEHIANNLNLWDRKVKPQIITGNTMPLNNNWLKEVDVVNRDFIPEEIKWWSVGGVISTQLSLNSYGINAARNIWFNKELQSTSTTFVFVYTLAENIYQIYKPLVKNRANRFRSNNASKIFGLEYCQKDNDYIVITKSRKDAYFLCMLGVNACFVLNETYTITNEDMDLLLQYGKKVFLYGDNDEAGLRYLDKMKTLHPLLVTFHNPIGEPKDFTDFLAKYFKEKALQFVHSILKSNK